MSSSQRLDAAPNYLVQRTWSNAAAAAGHAPCAPSPSAPYFHSVPVLCDTISIPAIAGIAGPFPKTTKGVHIAPGGQATIAVELFSDAPTSGPWTVSARQLPIGNGGDGTLDVDGGTGTLTFAFDTTSGVNGDTLRLTITVAAGATGGELFQLVSTLGTTSHAWYGLVGN